MSSEGVCVWRVEAGGVVGTAATVVSILLVCLPCTQIKLCRVAPDSHPAALRAIWGLIGAAGGRNGSLQERYDIRSAVLIRESARQGTRSIVNCCGSTAPPDVIRLAVLAKALP